MMDLDLHGPDGIRTALTYILPQLNAQPTVSGFSPAQWLLGYQPTVLLIILTRSHRCICPVVPPSKKLCGGEVQQRILQADTVQRLRRALLRRYAGDNIRLAVGQTCFFWRDAQRADLVKIRWKGPAKVLMVENNEAGNVSTNWICYKTQLIRCAPHHCRPEWL